MSLFYDVLLNNLHSGDDRDYCEYTHTPPEGHASTNTPVREVTVKSFSPDKNVRNPGFHMLSLVPPHYLQPNDSPAASFADAPCFLPSQARMYTAAYIPGSLITIAILLIHRFRQRRDRPRQSPLPSYQFDGDRTPSGSGPSRRSLAAGPGLRCDDTRKGVSLQRKRQASFRRSGPPATPLVPPPSGSAVARIQGALKRVTGLTSSPSKEAPVYVSTAHAKTPRTILHVVQLATLDFFRVIWPATLLWIVTMWYITR